jgi:arginyl-tRNA synthetase
MFDIKESLEKSVASAIKKLGVEEEVEFVVERPKDESMGDFATNAAMVLAKQLKKSPLKIAEELKEAMDIPPVVVSVEAVAPGFLNFKVDDTYFLHFISDVLDKGVNFGRSEWGNGKKWLIEHTSANPNKAMHFGHLRNNVLGMAISNIWEAIGLEVVRDYIDNNRGIAISKLMWGYLKFARKDNSSKADIKEWFENKDKWMTPEENGEKPDHFIDKLYQQASKDVEENKESESIVRQMVLDWENEDPVTWELWRLVMHYSHSGLRDTLERLGGVVDHYWYEHEIYQQGKDIVKEGLDKGIFQQLEDGAVLTNLKDFKIPDTVVLKRDGTSLYITQDLALTKLKKETFNPDKMHWVVGPDQNLALRQVFAVSDQLGVAPYDSFVHITFGYVSIKGSGKMSSRKGNVIYIDDLLDQAKEEVKTRLADKEFTEEEKEEISEKVGVGSVKYSILKLGRTTDLEYDFETSLSFDGDSAPYIMYTYVRANNIFNQYTEDLGDITDEMLMVNLIKDEEIDIARHLYKFEDVVLESGTNYAPNLLALYLYELAQAYNKFYNNVDILTSPTEDLKRSRVALSRAVSIVLENGLKMLGIDTVEKM